MSLQNFFPRLGECKTVLKQISKVSLICSSAVVLLGQQPASALVVDVPGYGSFNIQVQDTTFPSLSPPASAMPWWNDQPAASAFATATGSIFGSLFNNLGPFFAWGTSGSSVYMDAFCIGAPCFNFVGAADSAFSFGPLSPAGSPVSELPYPWAIATRVSTTSSVPGPLPLFGVAAAFGYSRRLRRRLKVRQTLAETLPRD